MARHPLYLIATATLLTSMTAACADESAPNRRGIERPMLFGGANAVQNAEKRENEAPSNKKSGPNVNSELPGQSRLETNDNGVLMLDVVGTAATTPAAIEPVTATASTTPAATVPASTLPQPQVQKKWQDEKHAYAVPGKTMVVPDTGGQVIPASWGEPVVLASYPHRVYADKKVSYMSGETLHNPYYYHFLFVHEYNPVRDSDVQGKQDLHDVLEMPWFYGETLALPVLMVIHCPWSQQSTTWVGGDPLYAGGLPAAGNIIPAPYPGEIHYTYEFSTGHASYDPTPVVPAR